MYETFAQFAQTGGLVLFVGGFFLVLAYALGPAASEEFERAKRLPLDEEDA
jgi:cbb3-type cytochrome oxidase subunit 3